MGTVHQYSSEYSHIRPSEIDKYSRVRARMDFPGFGPALDKEFVKGESIPEKKNR